MTPEKLCRGGGVIITFYLSLSQAQVYDPAAEGHRPTSPTTQVAEGTAPATTTSKPWPLNKGTPLTAGCSSPLLKHRYVYTEQHAAGDSGSTTCGTSTPGTTLSYPAVSPFVTAVGGTRLALGAGNTRVSEVVWNDSKYGVQAAGGGGLSRKQPRPAYQDGFNPQNHRAVPDISALADIVPGWPDVISSKLQTVGGTSGATPLAGRRHRAGGRRAAEGRAAAYRAGQRLVLQGRQVAARGLLRHHQGQQRPLRRRLLPGRRRLRPRQRARRAQLGRPAWLASPARLTSARLYLLAGRFATTGLRMATAGYETYLRGRLPIHGGLMISESAMPGRAHAR